MDLDIQWKLKNTYGLYSKASLKELQEIKIWLKYEFIKQDTLLTPLDWITPLSVLSVQMYEFLNFIYWGDCWLMSFLTP